MAVDDVLTFDAMPVEMKTLILSHLSVNDILQAGTTHRSMWALVKEKENQRSLYQPVMDRATERLQRSVDELFSHDPGTTTFVETMKRQIDHRGIWISDPWDLRTFAMGWVHRIVGLTPSDNKGAIDRRVLGFALAAKHISDLHFQHHMSGIRGTRMRYEDVEQWRYMLRRLRPYVGTCQGLSDEEIDRTYNLIKDTVDGFLGGSVHGSQGWQKTGGLPDWPITQLAEYDCPYIKIDLAKYGGCCTIGQLVHLLGVPPIPDFGHYTSFAYCVESEWAYKWVKWWASYQRLKA